MESWFSRIEKEIKNMPVHNSYIPIIQSNEQLYFIQEGTRGNIKIGLSKNPKSRLNTLQIGNSKLLRLIWYCTPQKRGAESKVHKLFKHCNVSGEWFYPHEDLLRFILTTIIHCQIGQWFAPNNEILFYNRGIVS